MPGSDHTDEETYSAAQTAKVLGVSRRHVLNLLHEGELEGFRETDGSAWKILQWSVHALKDRRPTIDGTSAALTSPPEATEYRNRVEVLSRELGRLEGRLELSEQTESTLRETLERERQRADRLEEALEEERSRGFWQRIFGR